MLYFLGRDRDSSGRSRQGNLGRDKRVLAHKLSERLGRRGRFGLRQDAFIGAFAQERFQLSLRMLSGRRRI